MKVILIATKLDAHATDLLVSACCLANRNRALLVVLHVVESEEKVGGRDAARKWEALKVAKEAQLQERLLPLKDRIPENVSIEFRLFAGDVVKNILELADELQPNVTLVGAGKYGQLHKQVRQIMTQAPHPVLAIPMGVPIHAGTELVYLSHLQQEDKRIMDKLLKISRAFGLPLHCVVVKKGPEDEDYLRWQQLYQRELQSREFMLEAVRAEQLDDTLGRIGRDRSSRLWVMPLKVRSWWQRLLGRSDELDLLPSKHIVSS